MPEFSGSRLREARGEMRAEQVAVEIGVSYQTVKNWEAGRTYPNAGQLAQMAALFGCTVDFFFVTAPAA